MSEENKKNINRRDALKGLATLPVAGFFAYSWYQKQKLSRMLKDALKDEVNLDEEQIQFSATAGNIKQIRLGIIGSGGRGRHLLMSAGFVQPENIDDWKQHAKENKADKRYEEYMQQEDLNLVVNGLCDVYEDNAEKGSKACANLYRNGSDGKMGKGSREK